MGSLWDGLRRGKKSELADLDYHLSLWVEKEELGLYKVIVHKKREITFRVPTEIDRKLILRLKGLGRKSGKESGNLILHLWLNKGEDAETYLWLSESAARNGATKALAHMQRRVEVLVPRNGDSLSTLRLKGLGFEETLNLDIPFRSAKRGDLLVRLRTYADNVSPLYRSFDSLDTDAMALEGWVYRKKAEIISRIGRSILSVQLVKAETIADMFNEQGWQAIFTFLVDHFRIAHLNPQLRTFYSESEPGKCEVHCSQNGNSYVIWISELFTDNPFAVAAILAHELSHVIYYESFVDMIRQPQNRDNKQRLEEERMVDLLVFLFGLGEFQLRVSRDRSLTIGYFNQETFDRMYVIVSRIFGSRP